MKLKKSFIFIFFFGIIPFSTKSQTKKIDDFNIEKIELFKGSNNDSLLFYSRRLQKSSDKCLSIRGEINEVYSIYLTSNYHLSEKKAKDILEELNDQKPICFRILKIQILNRLFWIKKNQNDYAEAFNYLLEAEEVLKTLKELKEYYFTNRINIKMQIALIKMILGYNLEARTILKKSLSDYKLFFKNNEKEQVHYSKILNHTSFNNLIGETYLNSRENNNTTMLDSASFYFNKAYQFAKEFTPPHKNSETLYQLKEAEVLIKKEKFYEAISLTNKYSKNAKEYNTTQKINYLKAVSFYKLNRKDSAFLFSNNYLKGFIKSNYYQTYVHSIYDILTNLYFEDNKIDSAFKYSKLTLKELNYINKRKNKVNQPHYLYDFKKATELNQAILKSENKNQNSFVLTILILGILLIILMLFFINKAKKSSLRIIEMNKQLDKKESTPKKEYNIDKKLEDEILQSLKELETSKDFLKTDFSINMLAKKLNTNKTYISYIVNKAKNQSFTQYLTEVRINYLINQLKEDKNFRNYTIKALAQEIGYTNASAFTRVFKIYKGVTPSEYIKSLENDTN
ncbi:AraC-like DNA-binding protein [Lutibacter sp. Hel_I_33_5]|uniref:helix-turn-helix domain-containing protein n=1 Tax=Lutibacter sp. Hel_I_33_5 TaxID=1566289 RepID=UPI0011AB112B|nr:AraC family transcriptional regulator [Lutibacter sp. Hel_I_33_5]TVZ55723.1 AraC-like DNA-binding protein [Lutibacter sp. Hel_I_33_5]